MSGISIQFHAVPEELKGLIVGAVAEFDLTVVSMEFSPFAVAIVERGQIEQLLLQPKGASLCFSLDRPRLNATGQIEFIQANPELLHLRIGRYEKGELHESWLTTQAADASAFAVWQKIARRLKKMTSTGGVALNPRTGMTGPALYHRFTARAKQLDQQGVVMKPIAGGVIFHFSGNTEK